MRQLKSDDNAFTGLEAAIVLIAFVVVAAVFSYVVLGAGFFTTQKAQETVHTGVQQTTSAVEPSGPVTINAATGTTVGNISFYLQLAAGGTGVDMSKVTYTVSTPKRVTTFTNADVNYTWVKRNTPLDAGQTSHAGLLNSREMVLIDINPVFGTDLTNNDKFIVEVKPPVGAALPIARTVPAGMTATTWYEVY
jgi:archaeal flagellin FlaB